MTVVSGNIKNKIGRDVDISDFHLPRESFTFTAIGSALWIRRIESAFFTCIWVRLRCV